LSKHQKDLKPSKATTSPKITKKQPKTKSVPAKGLEEDEDDSDLELENEVDEENALAELEQQQSHLQGVNEEEEDVRPRHPKLIIGTFRRIRI
jgi:uncharacterized protein involved in exopolysaccharide biosynthesis